MRDMRERFGSCSRRIRQLAKVCSIILLVLCLSACSHANDLSQGDSTQDSQNSNQDLAQEESVTEQTDTEQTDTEQTGMDQADAGNEDSDVFQNVSIGFDTEYVKEGVPLTVHLDPVLEGLTLTYTWEVNGTVMKDQNTDSYIPVKGDLEKFIKVSVSEGDTDACIEASIYYSTFPVVYVTTDNGQEITSKEDEVPAKMDIQGNAEFDKEEILYSGDIRIRGRGNYTWEHVKKPYKIVLDTKTDLLSMGKSKHFVLLANYVDPTLMKNTIFSELARDIGMEYYMECEPVVLIMNGEYCGVYHLSENVRVDNERVDIYDWEDTAEEIAKSITKSVSGMSKTDQDAMEDQLVRDLSWVTTREFTYQDSTYKVDEYAADIPTAINGGYLLELDTYDYYHVTQASDFDTAILEQPIQFNSPEFVEGTNQEMFDYVTDYINAFERAVVSEDYYTEYNGSSVHYSELFDMDSLVKYWMMMELMSCTDGMRYSNYMYQDFNSLFKMGPIWDYDWTWNEGYVVPANEWWTDQLYYNEKEHWYQHLVQDPYFIAQAYRIYHEKEDSFDQIVADDGIIDGLKEKFLPAGYANLNKWIADYSYTSGDYVRDIADMKQYATARFAWLKEQFSSVDTLMESFGYEESEYISLTKVEDTEAQTVEASVTGLADAKAVVFFVNGKVYETIQLRDGKAQYQLLEDAISAQSVCVVQARVVDKDGTYCNNDATAITDYIVME